MGTRALITINEKPFIATHWDGYPDSLGADLYETTTKAQIIKAVGTHSIDFAAPEVVKKVAPKRFAEIAAKTNGKYSAADVEQLYKEGKQLTFTVQGAGDYPVSPIANYGDWAEYQYDLTNGKWRYRALSGAYPGSMNGAEPLKTLTKKVCKL